MTYWTNCKEVLTPWKDYLLTYALTCDVKSFVWMKRRLTAQLLRCPWGLRSSLTPFDLIQRYLFNILKRIDFRLGRGFGIKLVWIYYCVWYSHYCNNCVHWFKLFHCTGSGCFYQRTCLNENKSFSCIIQTVLLTKKSF